MGRRSRTGVDVGQRARLGGGSELRIAPVLPGLLGVAAIAVVSPWLAMMQSTLTAVLMAVVVLQVVYHAVRSVLSGYELLQVVFWVFAAGYLVIPAIYQLAYLRAAWMDYYLYLDDRRVQTALVVLNLAFAAFGFGARDRPDRRLARPPVELSSVVPGPSRAPASDSAKILLAFCAGAALLLPAVLARTGFSALFSSRAGRTDQLAAAGIGLEQSGGAVVALYQILPGALALAAAYGLLMQSRGQTPVARAGLLVALGLVVVYLNPLANTRYASSTAVVALLLVVLQPRSRRGMAAVAAGLILGLFAVYPVANVFRSPTAEPEPLSLSSIDFDGFQQLINTEQYVEERGHPFGKHLQSAVLFFVPRSLWESKARPASIDVAENRGYSFTNLSLPIPGELYLDLGAGGVAIAMYGWGRLWRRLDDDWREGYSTPGARLVPYLAIAQVGLLRGPLGNVLPAAGMPVVLLVIALILPGWAPAAQLFGIRRGLSRSAGNSTT